MSDYSSSRWGDCITILIWLTNSQSIGHDFFYCKAAFLRMIICYRHWGNNKLTRLTISWFAIASLDDERVSKTFTWPRKEKKTEDSLISPPGDNKITGLRLSHASESAYRSHRLGRSVVGSRKSRMPAPTFRDALKNCGGITRRKTTRASRLALLFNFRRTAEDYRNNGREGGKRLIPFVNDSAYTDVSCRHNLQLVTYFVTSRIFKFLRDNRISTKNKNHIKNLLHNNNYKVT